MLKPQDPLRITDGRQIPIEVVSPDQRIVSIDLFAGSTGTGDDRSAVYLLGFDESFPLEPLHKGVLRSLQSTRSCHRDALAILDVPALTLEAIASCPRISFVSRYDVNQPASALTELKLWYIISDNTGRCSHPYPLLRSIGGVNKEFVLSVVRRH